MQLPASAILCDCKPHMITVLPASHWSHETRSARQCDLSPVRYDPTGTWSVELFSTLSGDSVAVFVTGLLNCSTWPKFNFDRRFSAFSGCFLGLLSMRE